MHSLAHSHSKRRQAIKNFGISIIAHRGLDPARENYFSESSREAFADQISRGFGLEFDLQQTQDGSFVVIHDSTLARATEGADTRKIAEVILAELLQINMKGSHLVSFKELLQMIADNPQNLSINAIHVKSKIQEPECLGKIMEEFQGANPERFIFFDLKIDAARYLKEKNPAFRLAASVAHSYDIERYNGAVGGTLLSLEEIIKNKNVYDWAWLDEWDRTDRDGGIKSLYDRETFEQLRSNEFKIALVTPELHATSPGLLGGEAHQDAANQELLKKRLKEILDLRPDAVCSDWPDMVKSFIEET